MRISRAWLTDFVDFDDLSAEDFSELITTRVAEVDELFTIGAPVVAAVAAKVLSTRRIESSKKLCVATVSTGNDEHTVVCGAPNCKAGMTTVFVPPGSSIVVGEGQKTAQVEKREVYGVESCGILVSEFELGIASDHSGIISLEETVAPGTSCVEVFGAGPDTVLEIDNKSLTHRPDLWSHYGFARELAAILGRPLKLNMDCFADDDETGREFFRLLGSGTGEVKVAIADGCPCRRFTGVEISNVSTICAPLWMRRRLFSVGAGVRNLLVDLSNYVMHDIGQPNHAYDVDAISGDTLLARMAVEGERFTGLDGLERELSVDDIVIADDSCVVGLGGVIGGAGSSVSDTTKRVFLESANFDPVCIRLTSKRHQLRTDASNRFEKSRSAYSAPIALHRFVDLLREADPRISVASAAVDAFAEVPKSVQVSSKFSYIRQRLGHDISNADIATRLSALGFVFRSEDVSKDDCEMSVPYYRATRDISIPDDLVEEVGRIIGYENIPECAPKIVSTSPQVSRINEFEFLVRDALRGAGLSEVYNYSFMALAQAESFGYTIEEAIELINTVDVSEKHMRTTLVPGMCKVLETNFRNNDSSALFEIGRSYHLEVIPSHESLVFQEKYSNAPVFERRMLGIGFASGAEEVDLEPLLSPRLKHGADFYALFSIISRVCSLVARIKPVLTPLKIEQTKDAEMAIACTRAADHTFCRAWMHPYRAATISVNGINIGVIAEIQPGAVGELCKRSVIAELDLELLLEADMEEMHFKPIRRCPDSLFEVSVVMPTRSSYRALEEIIFGSEASSLLQKVEVLSVYSGEPLKEGEKSISIKLVLGSDDHTLSSDELEDARMAVLSAIEQSSFELRS